MAKDAEGKPLEKGDLVIHAGTSFLYQVIKIDEMKSSVYIVGNTNGYASSMFIKVIPMNVSLSNSQDYSILADAIMKLINSQPRSPRKEEIVAILKGANNNWTCSTCGNDNVDITLYCRYCHNPKRKP